MNQGQERVVATNVTDTSSVVPMYSREVMSTIVAGLLVGALTAGTYYVLNKYVFAAVLCRDVENAAADCASAPGYAMAVAMVVSVVAGLLALVQARVYRPLLVVLATAISLWGFHALSGKFAWYWGILLISGLFALSYLTYAWLARVRSFVLAMVLAVIVVVLVRLALTS